MREIITLQVGQCGNQIGRSFWDLVLNEHASNASEPVFTEPMSSFFRNVDSRTGHDLPQGNGDFPIRSLRARTVLVDTEEGVLNETLGGPLGELFDHAEIIRGVSGAGNNFAHGFHGYGPQYREKFLNLVRRAAERCDSLQSFFLMHSLGGGTGSGMGSYVLSVLQDEFPEVFRLSVSVFPSKDDDVVTSPYNAAFAVRELREHADCVLPIENQALIDICNKVNKHQQQSPTKQARDGESAKKPFDEMNNLAAHMISNLTSCSRFSGQLNVDLSELTTNMVPFPKVHFLLSSLSPLYTQSNAQTGDNRFARGVEAKPFRNMFSNAFHRDNQLTKSNPQTGLHLSCAMLVRGAVELSDVNLNIKRLLPSLNMVPWNTEGFKVGLCSVSPPGLKRSVLCLTNNCCIKDSFAEMERKFDALYTKRKAYVHHFTSYMDEGNFAEAKETLELIQQDYADLERMTYPSYERMSPVIT